VYPILIFLFLIAKYSCSNSSDTASHNDSNSIGMFTYTYTYKFVLFLDCLRARIFRFHLIVLKTAITKLKHHIFNVFNLKFSLICQPNPQRCSARCSTIVFPESPLIPLCTYCYTEGWEIYLLVFSECVESIGFVERLVQGHLVRFKSFL
jgi:hypothetical protein